MILLVLTRSPSGPAIWFPSWYPLFPSIQASSETVSNTSSWQWSWIAGSSSTSQQPDPLKKAASEIAALQVIEWIQFRPQDYNSYWFQTELAAKIEENELTHMKVVVIAFPCLFVSSHCSMQAHALDSRFSRSDVLFSFRWKSKLLSLRRMFWPSSSCRFILIMSIH